MVYLHVYESIFQHLKEAGMLEDIFDHAEELIKPLIEKAEGGSFQDELILEFALFNYYNKGNLLIDYLDDNLYEKLNDEEKDEFDRIYESERYNLKFQTKTPKNEVDLNGKDLYYFRFLDTDSNELLTIISAADLDKTGEAINARLIESYYSPDMYCIIGGIVDSESQKRIDEVSVMKHLITRMKESNENFDNIMNYSRNNSRENIKSYSLMFPRQDRKIMNINRDFVDRFGLGIDEFLNKFFELSSKEPRFVEMAKHYLSVADALNKALSNTNYSHNLPLLDEVSLIGAFIALLDNDIPALEAVIMQMQKEARKEFNRTRIHEIATSREKIIANQKKYLTKVIQPLKLEGFDEFFNKINSVPADQIKEFLGLLCKYLEEHAAKLPDNCDSVLSFFSNMLARADEIPYLKDVKSRQDVVSFNPNEYFTYEYLDAKIKALHILIYGAYLVSKGRNRECYELFKKNPPAKIESFELMMLAGKAFSMFDDYEYKSYFRIAKGISKERYKKELEEFLMKKELNVLG